MVFVVVIAVGVLMSIDYQRRLKHDPFATLPPGRHLGNEKGEYRIVEFIDFLSPECSYGHKIIREFIAKYPQDVLTQARFFPHDDRSIAAAVHGQCASLQDKFWPFLDLLAERYYQWADLPAPSSVFKNYAADLKFDPKALDECLATEDPASVVLFDRALGESVSVRVSPSYLLNGQLVVGVDGLKKALERWDEELSF